MLVESGHVSRAGKGRSTRYRLVSSLRTTSSNIRRMSASVSSLTPGSAIPTFPLRGGPITPAIAASAIYRAAHDMADRVGIEQGYLLAPDVERPTDLGVDDDLLSLAEAAELIGITRPAVHQAVKEERLRGRRVGNAWVIRRADAETFRLNRQRRSSASTETARA